MWFYESGGVQWKVRRHQVRGGNCTPLQFKTMGCREVKVTNPRGFVSEIVPYSWVFLQRLHAHEIISGPKPQRWTALGRPPDVGISFRIKKVRANLSLAWFVCGHLAGANIADCCTGQYWTISRFGGNRNTVLYCAMLYRTFQIAISAPPLLQARMGTPITHHQLAAFFGHLGPNVSPSSS